MIFAFKSFMGQKIFANQIGAIFDGNRKWMETIPNILVELRFFFPFNQKKDILKEICFFISTISFFTKDNCFDIFGNMFIEIPIIQFRKRTCFFIDFIILNETFIIINFKPFFYNIIIFFLISVFSIFNLLI